MPSPSSRPDLTADTRIPAPAGLSEPRLSENARKVLANRYLAKDECGEVVEEPRELFWRVASAVASAEEAFGGAKAVELQARRFYELMARGEFVPNSPTLMNAGREMGMLSACFVLPVEDSINGIFGTLHQVALIQKAGGGTGFSFSRLRPDGDVVSSSGGRTSGPLSFIDAFSAATEAIQQGAFRRGANMGVLRCDHPDVIEFIRAKDDLTRWTNYNVSVAATDEWMRALSESPSAWMTVVNPRDGRKAWLRKTAGGRRVSIADYDAYAAGEGVTGAEYWTGGEVLDMIIHYAWKNGEPGLLFLDRANADNQLPQFGDYEASNPCGEQILPAYGSCNLGSINLGRFLREEVIAGGKWEERFDFVAFDRAVAESVRFLDDVVTINRFPVQEIRDCAEKERRIGLGVMGFADLLYGLGVAYGSEQSYAIARSLSLRLVERSLAESERMVAEDGRPPFGAWEGSRAQQEGLPRRRNSYLTTVAPTGTISIIAGCSGGIEPMFSLAFKRQVMKNADGVPVVMTEIHPIFEAALTALGITGARAQAAVDYALEKGTIRGAKLPTELEDVFVTAHDVKPEQHVLMQAAWQTSIDNAVSKTINLPHDAKESDVRAAYLLAWKQSCKGVTVYRDGCRAMQPMALGHGTGTAPPEAPAASAVTARPLAPMRLPEIMPCVRIRQATPFGNMHVKISVEPKTGREMELFAQLGKGGDLANSDLEAICRMVSLYLRIGGSLDDVVKQLDGIGSTLSVPSRDGRILSLADGLARAMHRWRAAKERFGVRAILLGEADLSEVQSTGNGSSGAPPASFKIHCPACDDGTLIFEEGCCKCPGCGYSQC
ncbi:MAG: adenosylcobalamin-dependent ribonucleoside-diphosphate reductase [Planctomycetota bacterium]|nr:adenosylcobalamin-dependent ribonucleoside-diphosphate reductase [Planctomycetota bacterium]